MEDAAQSVSLIAVVVAAVSAFVLGGIWYSPAVFAKAWMRECGVPEETLKAGSMPKIFGLSFLLQLMAAYVFGMFLGPAPDLMFALGAGFSAGLFWVASAFGVSYLFERRSLKLFLINGGYNTALFTVFGLVFGLIH